MPTGATRELDVVRPRTAFLDRDAAILALARGRRVLHLGCVGNTDLEPAVRARMFSRTLHARLSEVADVVGVDYSAEVVADYRARGVCSNIVCGDVQRLEELTLEGRFDVIIAADIIEHLSNPGRMLDGIRRICSAESTVVLTTPNAFGLPNYLRFCLGRFREGQEHVMTFNEQNLRNLLERHGYRVHELHTSFQGHARHLGPLFSFGKWALSTFPRLGGTLFAVASAEQASARPLAFDRRARSA
jgi:2-polyprenyl-3-methyl-5-hydroxy-6-metoxy-1,4-benzoquinol methylase